MSQGGDCRQFIDRCMALIALAAVCWPQPGSAVGRLQNGMVFVPARRATVGTSISERAELAKRFDCHPTWLGDDLPKSEVSLPAFWIDRYPVTNAQYLAFVEATSHARPSWWGRWGGAFPADYANHPVTGVSGKDAVAYAKWAGKRLPSAEVLPALRISQARFSSGSRTQYLIMACSSSWAKQRAGFTKTH